MAEVTRWLEGLQLDAVVPVVKENAVNGEDLLSLTEQDLKDELGCTPLQVGVHTMGPHAPHTRPGTQRQATHRRGGGGGAHLSGAAGTTLPLETPGHHDHHHHRRL